RRVEPTCEASARRQQEPAGRARPPSGHPVQDGVHGPANGRAVAAELAGDQRLHPALAERQPVAERDVQYLTLTQPSAQLPDRVHMPPAARPTLHLVGTHGPCPLRTIHLYLPIVARLYVPPA